MNSEELKKQGNDAFLAKDYNKAIELFTQAIELNPSQPVYYSNRSGCYAQLQNWEKALEDGKKCLELDPNFVKGYSRVGLA